MTATLVNYMMTQVTISVTPLGETSVSFQKAEQLLDLATLAAARRFGITLDDVIERFGISKRTAQRMLRALEMQFPDLQDRWAQAMAASSRRSSGSNDLNLG